MDWLEMKRRRQTSIDEMKDVLDQTEPLGLNVVAVFCLGIPVIAWQWLKAALSISVACMIGLSVLMFKMIMTPFIAGYLIMDIAMISLWYLKEISKKISEEPK